MNALGVATTKISMIRMGVVSVAADLGRSGSITAMSFVQPQRRRTLRTTAASSRCTDTSRGFEGGLDNDHV